MATIADSLIKLGDIKAGLSSSLSSQGISVPSNFSDYAIQIDNFNATIAGQLYDFIQRGGQIAPQQPTVMIVCNQIDLQSWFGSLAFIQTDNPTFDVSIIDQGTFVDITSYGVLLEDSAQNIVPITYWLDNPSSLKISLDNTTLNFAQQYKLILNLNNTIIVERLFMYTGAVITNIYEGQFNVPVNTTLTFELTNGDTFDQANSQLELITNPGMGEGSVTITGQKTYNETGTIMTFTPDSPLPYNTAIGTPMSPYILYGQTYGYMYLGNIWFKTEQEGGSI